MAKFFFVAIPLVLTGLILFLQFGFDREAKFCATSSDIANFTDKGLKGCTTEDRIQQKFLSEDVTIALNVEEGPAGVFAATKLLFLFDSTVGFGQAEDEMAKELVAHVIQTAEGTEDKIDRERWAFYVLYLTAVTLKSDQEDISEDEILSTIEKPLEDLFERSGLDNPNLKSLKCFIKHDNPGMTVQEVILSKALERCRRAA